MRIADTQIEISVFVCVDEEVDPGLWVRIPKATAFLATIKGDPFWTGYVVTASHIIEGAGNRRLYLRVNTEAGFDYIEINREEWFIHDHYDVAIVRVKWTGEQPYKLYSIYPEQFVHADYSLQIPAPSVTGPGIPPSIQVGTGDQISIIGLFVQHYGRSKSLPIVRTGTIARMPSAPVRYKRPGSTYSEQVAYLVEFHSHGGLSGSPVYVHRPIPMLRQALANQPGSASSVPVWIQDPEDNVINFLGLVSGHFDIDQVAATTGDIDGTVTVAINAGIAVVTPAEAVRELLWRDDVVADRLESNEAAVRARDSGSAVLPEERVIIHHQTGDGG